MRNLQFFLGATLITLLISLSSCEKEAQDVINQDLPTSNVELVEFTSVEDENAYTLSNPDTWERTLQDEDLNPNFRACCAGVQSIKDVWWGSWVNLNIKYELGSNQEVRIFHYHKVNGQWKVLPYNKIGSSYSNCTPKGVNMGTGHLPSGDLASGARLWDKSSKSYCGSTKYVFWSK